MDRETYEVVKVTTPSFDTEYMVVRNRYSESTMRVVHDISPQGAFASQEEAETFVKEIDKG